MHYMHCTAQNIHVCGCKIIYHSWDTVLQVIASDFSWVGSHSQVIIFDSVQF